MVGGSGGVGLLLLRRNIKAVCRDCRETPNKRFSTKLLKEERSLSKEGLEDEEGRDSHAPEGLPF